MESIKEKTTQASAEKGEYISILPTGQSWTRALFIEYLSGLVAVAEEARP